MWTPARGGQLDQPDATRRRSHRGTLEPRVVPLPTISDHDDGLRSSHRMLVDLNHLYYLGALDRVSLCAQAIPTRQQVLVPLPLAVQIQPDDADANHQEHCRQRNAETDHRKLTIATVIDGIELLSQCVLIMLCGLDVANAVLRAGWPRRAPQHQDQALVSRYSPARLPAPAPLPHAMQRGADPGHRRAQP